MWLMLIVGVYGSLISLIELNRKVRIMASAISDFSDRVTKAFDEIGASVDAAVQSLAGVAKDVTDLKALIDKLQNTPGAITPEDQALLDQAQAKADLLVTKTAALKQSLAELDAQTEEPPPAPVP